ncbi:MAG: AI-2E family transporter [Gammaproteobacteria bacterium]|nr:AI-2E family transporter [Gammaproteobacteria bacterium]MYF67258.1 AI-2E family transporter [Gammaproteobacteria bacterium]MYK36691.1 AI-2E family transporter [Gammaproteobacteria bacterium]
MGCRWSEVQILSPRPFSFCRPSSPVPVMGQTLQRSSLLLLVAAVTAAFILLLADLLLAVFWAVVLAILFHGLYARLIPRLWNRRSLAAAAVLLVVLAGVVAPVLLLGWAVVRESSEFYAAVEGGALDPGAVLDTVGAWLPWVREILDNFGLDFEKMRSGLTSMVGNAARFAATGLVAAGQGALKLLLQLAVMLYLLFFFLRDGEKLVDTLVRILPLGDEREYELLGQFATVSRVSVTSLIVIGAVQGGLGGVTLALLGIGSPVLLGVLMGVLSVIPAVGPGLVWAPIAIWLFASGMWIQGLILVIVGVLVVGLADNLLRPILVGRTARLPDYLVLLATLGGLSVFGFSGLVIGPVLAALFLVSWRLFEEEFSPAENRDEP